MAKSLYMVLHLLLVYTDAVLGEGCSVIITTTLSNGPFLVDNEIEFTCYVDPTPSEPVTYSWHAVKDAYGATTLSSTTNTTRYTPSYSDLHESWLFCKVFSNGSLVGVGRKLVKIHGGTIRLRVNISNDSLASHIRELTWYHNETEIGMSNRISIQNGGKDLVVQNALSEDAGVYQVEVTSLNFSRYYRCDSTWLYFLKNHAAYGPVTFTVRELRSQDYGYVEVAGEFEEPPSKIYYPLVTGESSTLLTIQNIRTWSDHILAYVVSYLQIHGDFIAALHVNGIPLTHNQDKFNLSQAMTGNNLLEEVNYQYITNDEGFYTHQLKVYYFDIEDAFRDYWPGRCYDYSSHTHHLNLILLSFSTFSFILTSYQPPVVNITSYYNIVRNKELLNCTAYGGVPDSHNITLRQKDVNVTGNSHQVYLDGFGEYMCIVESLYNTTAVAVTINERASFQLLFVLKSGQNPSPCQQWKKSESVHLLRDEITDTFRASCDCAVDFYSLSVNCSSTGNLLVKGVVNSLSNISAGMIVDMLQVRLLTSGEPLVITLGEQSFQLNTHCPTKVNLASPDVCNQIQEVTKQVVCQQNMIGGAVGGSFVGGMILGALACVIVLFTAVCVIKLKSDVAMRRAGSTNPDSTPAKEEAVEMASNTAYETVDIRYHQPSTMAARETTEMNTREEPVYEFPAS